jgi:hypothetical protein
MDKVHKASDSDTSAIFTWLNAWEDFIPQVSVIVLYKIMNYERNDFRRLFQGQDSLPGRGVRTFFASLHAERLFLYAEHNQYCSFTSVLYHPSKVIACSLDS